MAIVGERGEDLHDVGVAMKANEVATTARTEIRSQFSMIGRSVLS